MSENLKQYVFIVGALIFIVLGIIAITGEVKLYNQQVNKQSARYQQYEEGKEYEKFYKKESSKASIIIVGAICVGCLYLFGQLFVDILKPRSSVALCITILVSIYVPISLISIIVYFGNINIFRWLI